MANNETYKIVQYFADNKRPSRVIKRGLSRTKALEHCGLNSTRGQDWFDGWVVE